MYPVSCIKAEYREVINIDPKDTRGYTNLGIAFEEMGRYEEAEKEYKKALMINPNDASAHGNLGILYKKQGKVKEAKNEILKAKELFANQGRFDEVRRCDEVLKDL